MAVVAVALAKLPICGIRTGKEALAEKGLGVQDALP
jgi:hypothetical protein